ncbi:hypothetical protein BHE74_00032391 [Ensete ventricosum]|nr:hypothetical protein GW17_00055932 [Ensete ventricosum]RWW60612.1 hypothetical protein BHE74_00032391 [Ensete ventricosum]
MGKSRDHDGGVGRGTKKGSGRGSGDYWRSTTGCGLAEGGSDLFTRLGRQTLAVRLWAVGGICFALRQQRWKWGCRWQMGWEATGRVRPSVAVRGWATIVGSSGG